MFKSLAPILVGAVLVAGCGAPDAGSQAETDIAADTTHGVSTDPLAATGFITTNSPPPATATEKNGVMRDGDGRPYTYDLLGETLPDVEGTMVTGEVRSTGALDQWTVIDVWGVWCGDCRKDGPYMAELADELAGRPDIDFLSIHTPASAARTDEAYGTYGSIGAYFDAVGFSYPTLVDPDAALRDALQIAWTPSYLLVSPEGVVKGFRTDLSVAEGADPVADFLDDIERVRAETG